MLVAGRSDSGMNERVLLLYSPVSADSCLQFRGWGQVDYFRLARIPPGTTRLNHSTLRG